MSCVLFIQIALFIFISALGQIGRSEPRDIEFCSLILQARGDHRVLANFLKDIGERAKDTKGLLFLMNHTEVFVETGILPQSWRPLSALPENVSQSLVRINGSENFEIIALLNQLRLAEERGPAGQPSPQALASQKFLSEVLQLINSRDESWKKYPALFDFIKERSSHVSTEDIYQESGPKIITESIVKDLFEIGESTNLNLRVQLRKIDSVYTLLHPKEKREDVGPGWRDLFAAQPKRSMYYLTRAGREDRAYEIYAILRMVKLAHGNPPDVPPELSVFSRHWLDSLFREVLSQSPKGDERYLRGRALLTSLRLFDLNL